MNKDELLIKFFNNELTEDEKQVFDELLESDAAFRNEFNRLKLVETELNGFATPLTLEDEAFIADTRKNLIKSPESKSDRHHHLYRRLYFFLAGALLITFVALYMWKADENSAVTGDTKKEHVSAAEKIGINNVENVKGVEKDLTQNDEPDLKGSKTDLKQEQKYTESTISPVEKNASETRKTDAEIQGKIKDVNPVKNQEIIAQLQSELEQYHNSGDLLNEVWTLKRLGTFYRQLGRYSESENFLTQALDKAGKLQDAALTAEIYGEMAYLFFVRGNKSKAEIYKAKCIDGLRQTSGKRAEYWDKKFKKFQ